MILLGGLVWTTHQLCGCILNTVVFSYLNILLLDIPTDSKRFKKWCPDMASGWEKPKHHDIAFSLDHPGILPPELCQCLIINNVYTSYVYIYVCVYIAMCSVWMDHGGSWLIYHELIHWYLVLPHFLDPKMLILPEHWQLDPVVPRRIAARRWSWKPKSRAWCVSWIVDENGDSPRAVHRIWPFHTCIYIYTYYF
jgi:hypothetical protein